MKNLKLEIFKLEPIGLYYFKLHKATFIFDEFYKEKILHQALEIPDARATVVLFKETIITRLSEKTYYLKLSLFYDATVIILKETGETKPDRVDINCVKKKGEDLLRTRLYNVMYNDGLLVFEFDRYREDLFIIEARLHNISKLILQCGAS